MAEYLKPKSGDEKLDSPPPGVQISLFALASKKHWSECIVGDTRPEE